MPDTMTYNEVMRMALNETLGFNVKWGGDTVATSPTITIVDSASPDYDYNLTLAANTSPTITEIDIPTYSLATNVTTVNEGGSITVTLTTTKLDTGASVPYTITGVTLSDVLLDSLAGEFTIGSNGKATLTIPVVNDALTEGNETLTLQLNNGKATVSTLINDTSLTPTFSLVWASNNTGTSIVTNVNEGNSVYLVLKTTNVINGTMFNYSLFGTNVTSADLNNASLTGTFTVNNNVASVKLDITSDRLTEGNETLSANAVLNSVTVNSTALTINDTSVTTTYTHDIYADVTTTTPLTEATENISFYLRLGTINGVSGDKFTVTASGVSAIVDGEKTWTNGNLNFLVTPTSTGTITLTIRNVTLGNIVVGTETINVVVGFIATPNGSYNHSNGPAEFILAPNSSKLITMYPAGSAPSNSDWDGASSGITGLYMAANLDLLNIHTYTGNGTSAPYSISGVDAVVGAFTYNGYDRNQVPSGSDHEVGYWDWGGLNGRGQVNKSGIYNGVRVTIINIDSNSLKANITTADWHDANIIQIRLTNETNAWKVMGTMYGGVGEGGGIGLDSDGEHGILGPTEYHGNDNINRGFSATWSAGNRTYVIDGYMVVENG